MAASDSQRNWNRFFDHPRTDGQPGGAAKGPKKTRRARTTCENYDKPTESCRLDGTPCLSPGRCPDYARRPDAGTPAAGRPVARKPAPAVPVGTASGNTEQKGMSDGHAMGAVPGWDPGKPGDWNFVPGHVVVHKYFGQGTVVSTENGRLVVDFESTGRKTLLASFFSKHPIMYVKR